MDERRGKHSFHRGLSALYSLCSAARIRPSDRLCRRRKLLPLSSSISRRLPAREPQYAKVIHFGWRAGEGAEPVAIRYLWSPVVDTTGTYNPALRHHQGSEREPVALRERVVPMDTVQCSGRFGQSDRFSATTRGLRPGRYYIFAVQARDEAGRITDSFSARDERPPVQVRASAVAAAHSLRRVSRRLQIPRHESAAPSAGISRPAFRCASRGAPT